MVDDNPGSLALFDGAQETDVVAVAPGLLSLAAAVVRRAGSFTLIWRRGPDLLEMPVKGRVNDDGLSFAIDEAPGADLFAPFIEGRAGLDAAMFRLAVAAKPAKVVEPRHRARTAGVALVVALCVLGVYDAVRLYRSLVVITPRVAYLSTDVSTINSPTSGRLAFAAGAGDVLAGEPILGVENVNGKTVLIDAKADVRIVSQDRRVGELVRRGDPLLAVADTNPEVYLVAVMSREEAFQLADGATVKYTILGTGAPTTASVVVAGDQFERTLLPDPTGTGIQLYQVRFRIEDTTLLARAAPITLEFDASLTSGLVRLGLPKDFAQRLMEPLARLRMGAGA